MKKCAFIFMSLALLPVIVGAEESILAPSDSGPYAVGYRVRKLQDASRSFAADTARPMTVHLWYPAAPAAGKAMKYLDYVLAAKGIASGGPDLRNEILTAYKAGSIERDADEKILDSYLERPTRAWIEAAPEKGPFPLILYAPSINSEPFENAELFEWLAGHGYVVASAPCIGWDEVETERNVRGALAQWGDLGFVLNAVWREPFIDPGRIGVLGFSWGGMTGLQFALSQPGVKAVAVLDGAQSMAAYRAVAEAWPFWQPRRLRASVFALLPEGEKREPDFFAQTLYADTYVWKIPGIVHRDFSSDFIVQRRRAVGDAKTAEIEKTYAEIASRLKSFFDAGLKNAVSGRGLPAGNPEGGGAWTSRPALEAPPAPAEFTALIERGKIDEAVALFRRLRRADPGLILLEEPRLLEYGALWGPERSDDLLKLLEINLEMYPRSADTHFWLAQVYLARDDRASALRSLEAALAIDPNHDKALRLKKRIQGASSSGTASDD